MPFGVCAKAPRGARRSLTDRVAWRARRTHASRPPRTLTPIATARRPGRGMAGRGAPPGPACAGRGRPRRRGRRRRLLRRGHRVQSGGRARGPPRRRRLFPRRGFLIDGAPVVLDRRRPLRRPGARRPARSPRTRRARGSPVPRGSSWRAATTPSSSRRCGATTCAPRASSSSTCRASTCSSRLREDRPGRGDATACSSTTSCRLEGIAHRRRRRAGGAHVRIVGHPHIDVWQCVRPRRSASAHGPTCRAASSGRSASRARVARPRPGRPRAHVAAHPGIRPHVPRPRPGALGRVEELIDFVTE
jgi:hypothetical protein